MCCTAVKMNNRVTKLLLLKKIRKERLAEKEPKHKQKKGV